MQNPQNPDDDEKGDRGGVACLHWRSCPPCCSRASGAGFSIDVTTGRAELIPRGYAVSRDGGYDFYRKKEMTTGPHAVMYTKMAGVQLPSNIYEWYAKNGTMQELEDKCTPDQRCAGYYMCTTGKPKDNCAHLPYPASGVLLKGVPASSLLSPNVDAAIYAKGSKLTGACEH